MGIRELAKHLDLSIGTVSRALNGHPEVNADTRRRVLDAARQLGYVPNQVGRSLRKGVSNTIALMLSSDRTSKSDTGFVMEVCRGVQHVLARHELDLVLHLNKTNEDTLERVRRVVERRLADGLILAETLPHDPRLDYLTERAFPFATIGRSHSGNGHPWVDLDYDHAVAAAMQRLVGLGHRRIALVTGEPVLMVDQILQNAYVREHVDHRLAVDHELIRQEQPDESGGYRVTGALMNLPERPTAVLFAHSRAAVGAYSRLNELGLRPGRDIGVLCCSSDNAMARFFNPPLTCFRLDLFALGEKLGEALLSAMPAYAPQYGGSRVQALLPWQLIPRVSDAVIL